jgi:hypothetical protein
MSKVRLCKSDTVYIAGPMLGKRNRNIPAFDAAAQELRQCGVRVVSPADIDRGNGFDENTPEDQIDRRKCIAADISVIMRRCTAIALLRGWRKSKGAAVEVALGRFLGLKIFEVRNMEMVE